MLVYPIVVELAGNTFSMKTPTDQLSPNQRAQDSFSGDHWAGPDTRTGEQNFSFLKAIRVWVLPFTRFHRIPVAKRVWLYLAFMAVYVIAVDWLTERSFPAHIVREAGAAAYSGVILGLLLVFRTNSAYERWWEGRKLWGQLVNDSRNLSLKVRAYAKISNTEQTQLGELIVSFAYALKHHLRGTKPSQNLPGIGSVWTLPMQNVPVYIAGKIYDMVLNWHQAGRVDGFGMMMLDMHLKSYMDICGACERIKNSPLAVSYRAFMRQGIALNLLALPWYMVPEFSVWWSLPIILMTAYFLIGLELIAEDIEDPFGFDGDDLPLDQICDGIKKTITEILAVQEQQQYTSSFVLPRVDLLKEPN